MWPRVVGLAVVFSALAYASSRGADVWRHGLDAARERVYSKDKPSPCSPGDNETPTEQSSAGSLEQCLRNKVIMSRFFRSQLACSTPEVPGAIQEIPDEGMETDVSSPCSECKGKGNASYTECVNHISQQEHVNDLAANHKIWKNHNSELENNHRVAEERLREEIRILTVRVDLANLTTQAIKRRLQERDGEIIELKLHLEEREHELEELKLQLDDQLAVIEHLDTAQMLGQTSHIGFDEDNDANSTVDLADQIDKLDKNEPTSNVDMAKLDDETEVTDTVKKVDEEKVNDSEASTEIESEEEKKSNTNFKLVVENTNQDEEENFDDGLDSLFDGEISDIDFQDPCNDEVRLEAEALGRTDEIPRKISGADLAAAELEKIINDEAEDVAGKNVVPEENEADVVESKGVEAAIVEAADPEDAALGTEIMDTAAADGGQHTETIGIEVEGPEVPHVEPEHGEPKDVKAVDEEALKAAAEEAYAALDASDGDAYDAEAEGAQAEYKSVGDEEAGHAEVDDDLAEQHDAQSNNTEQGEAEVNEAKEEEAGHEYAAVTPPQTEIEALATARSVAECDNLSHIYVNHEPLATPIKAASVDAASNPNTTPMSNLRHIHVNHDLPEAPSTKAAPINTAFYPNPVPMPNLRHIYVNHESPETPSKGATPVENQSTPSSAAKSDLSHIFSHPEITKSPSEKSSASSLNGDVELDFCTTKEPISFSASPPASTKSSGSRSPSPTTGTSPVPKDAKKPTSLIGRDIEKEGSEREDREGNDRPEVESKLPLLKLCALRRKLSNLKVGEDSSHTSASNAQQLSDHIEPAVVPTSCEPQAAQAEKHEQAEMVSLPIRKKDKVDVVAKFDKMNKEGEAPLAKTQQKSHPKPAKASFDRQMAALGLAAPSPTSTLPLKDWPTKTPRDRTLKRREERKRAKKAKAAGKAENVVQAGQA